MDIRVLFPALAIIIALFIGGIMPYINKHPIWSFILWGLAGVFILVLVIYYFRVRKSDTKNNKNWIIVYQKKNRKLPAIPEYLLPIAPKYVKGSPISKDIGIITMSGQFWNKLLPSQREELKQLVEWLGLNWEDYLEQMKRQLPPSPRIRWL